MNGKKVSGGVITPRRVPCAAQRAKCVNGVDDAQFCNRIGCNGRLNSTRGTQIGCSRKVIRPTPSFCSSSEKEIIGNSSSAGSDVTHGTNSFYRSQRRVSSHPETSKSDMVVELQENSPPPSVSETKSGKTKLTDVGSSSGSSSNRPRKMLPQNSGPEKQKSPLGSSLSSTSRTANLGSSNIANGSRYGLRNMKCNSMSDVIPHGGYSPSEHRFLKRATVKKGDSEGESSPSCKQKKVAGHSPGDRHASRSMRGICISEPRHSRSWGSGTESGVRTRRSINVSNRFKSSDRGDGSNSEASCMILQLPRPEVEIDYVHTSSYQCSPEASSSSSSSYGLSAIDSDDLSGSMPFTSMDMDIPPFMNYEAPRQYSVDGIAEVLMELERIERNEEVTYEQLLALETNLFLSSLGIYDQHRDLRMDIDNMSYEELLALEERMGTVSTALSEEAISKCLNRSIYQPLFLEGGVVGSGDPIDIKCSVCQEEYEAGDGVGTLKCAHKYHVHCIEQWLRLKNWCPICKASAAANHPDTQTSKF